MKTIIFIFLVVFSGILYSQDVTLEGTLHPYQTELNNVNDSLNAVENRMNDSLDIIDENINNINIDISNINDSLSVHLDTTQKHREDINNINGRVNVLWDREFPVDSTGLILYYMLNEDARDTTEYENHGVASDSLEFLLQIVGQRGGLMADMFSVDDYVYSPSINIGNISTIFIDFALGQQNEPRRILYAVKDQYECILNPSDSSISLVTFNPNNPSDSSILTTGSGAFNYRTSWYYNVHMIAVIANNITGTGAIYINGLNTGATGSVEVGFNTEGPIYIGQDIDGDWPIYCMIDNFRVYNEEASSTDIWSLWSLSEYYVSNDDLTPPTLLKADVNEPNGIEITFSENLNESDTSNIRSGLIYKSNGSVIAIDSIRVTGSVIYAYTETVASGDILTLGYTLQGSSGIQDLFNNELATINPPDTINNNLCNNIQYIHYLFNNNATDDLGNLNATLGGTPPYFHSSIKVEGSHSWYNTGGGSATFILPSGFTMGDKATFGGWFYIYDDSEDGIIFSNMPTGSTSGFQLMMNQIDRLSFQTYHDGVVDSVYSTTILPRNEWAHIMIKYDKEISKGWIFINGTDVTTDDTMLGLFNTNGQAGLLTSIWQYRIRHQGFVDDFAVYNGLVPDDSIAYIYNNVAHLYSGCEYIPPPPPPPPLVDSADYYMNIVFELGFDDNVLGDYTRSAIIADFTQGNWIAPDYVAGVIGGSYSYPNEQNVHILNSPDAINGASSKAIRALHKKDRVALTGINHEPLYAEGSGVKWSTRTVNSGYQELYLSFNMMWAINADLQIDGKHPALRGYWYDSQSEPIIGFHTRINFMGGDFPGQTYGTYRWYANWASKGTGFNSSGNGAWAKNNGTGDLFIVNTTRYEWHNITIRAYANSPGSANGGMQVFVDGVLYNGTSAYLTPFYNLEVMYQMFLVNEMSFEYFFGGTTDGRTNELFPLGSADFAPESDVYWWCDDMYMWTPKATLNAPSSHTSWPSGSKLKYIPGYDVTNKRKTNRPAND